MSGLGHPPVLPDVVEEHFEELDFLWEQREGVVFALDWTLADLTEHEARAEAHLDGLRLAEMHAVELARPHLDGGDTFAAAAAAMVLAQNEAGAPALCAEVMRAMEAAEDETLRGIRIGLRHSPIAGVEEPLAALAASQSLPQAVAAADVLAFHRVPCEGAERLLEAEDPADRALAYGILGRQSALRDPGAVRAALAQDEAEIAVSALRAAAASGMPDLGQFCRTAATHPQTPSLAALGFLGLFGSPDDLPLLEACAQDEECAPVAIPALGALGRVQAIPLLLTLMGEGAAHPVLAGEAFMRITGVDDLTPLEVPPAQVDETDVEGEFEDDTPPPDPEQAAAWWEAHGEKMDPAARWQDGHAVDGGFAPERHSLGAGRDLYLRGRVLDGLADRELELRVAFR